MKISTIAEAQLAVTKYHGDYKAAMSSSASERSALQTSNHRRTYQLLAEASRICGALLEAPEVLAELLNSYGITAAGKGQNEFGPLVRALFRRPKKGGGTEANKSAWKFGNVLRFIHDEKWKPDEVATRLETLERVVEGRTYKKLLAAEMADRVKHEELDEERRTNTLALRHMLEGEGIGLIEEAQFTVEGRTKNQLVTLAASWDDARSKWVVRSVLSTNNDAIVRSVLKDAHRAFKEHSDNLFRNLAFHNADIAKLEESLKPSDRLALEAVRSDPQFVEVPLSQPVKSRSKSAVAA